MRLQNLSLDRFETTARQVLSDLPAPFAGPANGARAPVRAARTCRPSGAPTGTPT